MECSFWEFGAIVRHEKARHEAGSVSVAEARRKFDVPVFVFAQGSGLNQPEDPRATVLAAEDRVRSRGWIEPGGRLNDRWYEIVSALVHGQSFGYLYLASPDEAETRVIVTVSEGLAFRLLLRGDRVWIDEVRPDSAEQALVASLPEVVPASGREVRLPTAVLHAAGLEAENHKADQGDWIAYELGQAGVSTEDATAVGRLSKLADRATGQFNVGIHESDGTPRLAPWAITVHHSPSGRVAQIPQPPRGEQILVTPASNRTLAVALRTYRDELHQQVRDARRPRRSG
ncbi:ESX secretion-associated protein EspG [Saccharopolyspora spinosa]|uniref:ESAT-6 protein secretion system EspG family protein n=1 Tax=Saccharopolyspora spinosa TaxID=60894 RepID=A0A2N3Y8J2_SACSN|nr:ESX secretion-associated protein EspG [Saccharopolyspora spinosa]PKW19247.1 ESAT-6 protein secretion system EspG family protein [Saccharopolyspora spinosa]